MPDLTLHHCRPPTGSIVVRADGEIDLSSAPALRHAIAEAIWAHPDTVVIDLTDVEFMDSACVHAIVASAIQAANAGVELELHRPSGPLARVLDVCGLREPVIP